MPDYDEIQEALKFLDLDSSVSLSSEELENIYRQKMFEFHPDCREQRRKSGKDINIVHELMMTQKTNKAYKIIRDYMDNFRFPFTEEDVARVYPREEFLRRQAESWTEAAKNHV